MTPIRTAIDEYLDLRRALGFRLKKDERLLGQFAGFMEQRRAVHITAKLAVEWARQTPSTDQNYHAGRLRAVRSFARHRIHDDPMTEVPPTDMLPRRRNTFQPHIFTAEEIRRILAASQHKWGGATPFYCLGRYTLYGLISVTGMRVSEVLNLATVWVPHSYPACSQHAPDEHLLPAIAREGLRLMAGLYWDLGEPAAREAAGK